MRRWMIFAAATVALGSVAVAVALLALNESPWSLSQALHGYLGPSSPNIQAARLQTVLSANDSSAWSHLSEEALDSLRAELGTAPIRTVRLIDQPISPAANNPNNAWAWTEIDGVRFGFFMTRGRLTGWRVLEHHWSP